MPSVLPQVTPRLGALLLSTVSVLAVLPAAAQDTAAQDAIVLDQVVIEAEGASPVSGGTGYTVATTATGLKSGAPRTEVPMTVNTITQQELIDQNPVHVENVLAYVPGVIAPSWGNDPRYDQYSIRGFDLGVNGIFRDGLINKSQNFTGYKVDPYLVQRIDVLKGPASVLYGSNDAAGLVNLITKRPTFDHLGEARVSYGSHDTAEIAVDWGGVNADKTLSWRLTGLSRRGSTYLEPSENDSDLLGAALTWAPSAATSITLLAHWQKDDLAPSVNTPVPGQDYDAAFGVLPKSFLDQQHPWNSYRTEHASIGWQAEHAFDDSLKVRQNFRYARQTTDFRHMYYSNMASAGVMNYAAFTGDETASYWALDNQLEYRGKIGAAEHVLTIGADLSQRDKDGELGLGYYPIPLANPGYDFDIGQPPLYNDSKNKVQEQGIYVQDHIRLGNGVTITAGLRRSWVDNETLNHVTGVTTRQKDNATTGMIGGTWDLGNGFVPYASYGQSFTVNIGQTFAGEQFDPTEGEQVEVGLRYQPQGGQMQFSAALYNIKKTNVLTADAANPGFRVQTGEVRHRGLELEARGQVNDQLSLIAGYSYIDAKVLRSADGDQGNEPGMVPEHSASIWATYDFAGRAQGLTVGGGLRYVSESWASNTNTRRVGSHTVADMMLRYSWDDFSASLNVTNLFDKDYYSNCYDYGYGCGLGDGREATLTLSRSF